MWDSEHTEFMGALTTATGRNVLVGNTLSYFFIAEIFLYLLHMENVKGDDVSKLLSSP